MKRTPYILIVSFILLLNVATAQDERNDFSQQMAATAMKLWKDSLAPDFSKPARWTYDQGVVLRGMEAIWKNTGDAAYFDYIKHSMDFFVGSDGSIRTYEPDEYNIDHVNNGRALLLLYKTTGEEKYFKAASLLREQLRNHPRTNEGGFWHKKIYPYQMWLDGLYMAQPFYTEYSTLVHDDTAYGDIVNQFIYMENHARDNRTGLLYHGWDESKQQKWAGPVTGLSPNFWARAMGWYGMALVDVLENFPENNPKQKILLDILQRYASAIIKVQDEETGLWWDIMNYPHRDGNYFEASASSMFVYILAKAVRFSWLPKTYLAAAQKGYKGIIKKFIVKDAGGQTNLEGTVSVSGLGGNPYRDGSYEYYLSEKIVTNDPKGVGAFIQAAAEMELLPTLSAGKNETVLLDNLFNHETKKDITGTDIRHHYVWDQMSHGGFSLLGFIFNKYGVQTKSLDAAPTMENLKQAAVYIIVDPDNGKENTSPNFVASKDIDAISEWVKNGGVLVLLGNDSANMEFEHFNKLAERFGIHFNEDSYHRVTGNDFEMGAFTIPAKHPIFKTAEKIYIKELSTLQLKSPAVPVFKDGDHTIMAAAKIGRGTVFAIGDPWLYNEYTDGRKLPKEFENYKAAEDLVQWLIQQIPKNR